MKKLTDLKGVISLNRKQQKEINGGTPPHCTSDAECVARHGSCFVCTPSGFCFKFYNSPCNE